MCLTPRANKRSIVDQLTPNIVGCYMLRPFSHPLTCCCVLLVVVAQSLKPVKTFSYVQTDAITQHELLRPFAHSLTFY